MIYDALVLGGGPAGLSAALGLARQLYSVVVFDSQKYRNYPASHMHNILTWDHKSPADFRASARENILSRYDSIVFRESRIDNIVKLEDDGQKPMKAKELEERMEVVSEMQAKFKKENKTQKVEAEGKGPSVEKFETQIEKLDQRIATAKTQSEDRENNKEVALGTSKIVSCLHWVVKKKYVVY